MPFDPSPESIESGYPKVCIAFRKSVSRVREFKVCCLVRGGQISVAQQCGRTVGSDSCSSLIYALQIMRSSWG